MMSFAAIAGIDLRLNNMGILKKLKSLCNVETDFNTISGIRAIKIPRYPRINGIANPVNNIEYILQRKATIHKKNGRMDLAIECLRKSNEIMPHSNFVWSATDYLRLVSYLEKDGQTEEAKRVFADLARLFTTDTDLARYYAYGAQLFPNSDYASRNLKHQLTSIEANLKNASKQGNIMELESLRLQKCELTGETYRPLNPGSWEGYAIMSTLFVRKKEFENALPYAQKANQLCSDGRSSLDLARIYQKCNRLDDAIATLNKAKQTSLYKSKLDTDYWFRYNLDRELTEYIEKKDKGYIYRPQKKKS